MADLKQSFNPLFLREEELRNGMELLFYAYRDFTQEADAILAKFGLGRAHHRALYFIGRNPTISVSELLEILRITKQSLSRVLGEMIRQDLVTQAPGVRDRRRRHLQLTPQGIALERNLSERQRGCFARAYREAGVDAVEGFRKVLLGMVNDADRHLLQRPARAEHDREAV
ncbi:MAG: MarR family transcriptional regulator [Alphaproteobacteria bacterium]